MGKLRIILVFCLIVLLSGCSIEYDLIINEDSTVSEKVTASENTKRMESFTRQKGKQAVNYLFEMYKRHDENIELSSRTDDKMTYAIALNVHNNIQDYSSKFYSDIFDEIKVTREDNVINIYGKQSELISSKGDSNLIYDNVKINIKVPYEVINNNADSIKNNVYTWDIRKDEYKTIELSYKEGSKKDKINVNIKEKTYNINYGFVVVVPLLSIIIITILIIYIKNKKNNIV